MVANHPGAPGRPFVALLAAVGVFLSGCVSMKSVAVPLPESAPASVAVKVGDKVQVEKRSGETYLLKVTAVESDVLVGRAETSGLDVRIAYGDIAKLQVQRVDAARTTMAGAGTVLIIGVAAVVFLLGGGLHLNLMGA